MWQVTTIYVMSVQSTRRFVFTSMNVNLNTACQTVHIWLGKMCAHYVFSYRHTADNVYIGIIFCPDISTQIRCKNNHLSHSIQKQNGNNHLFIGKSVVLLQFKVRFHFQGIVMTKATLNYYLFTI